MSLFRRAVRFILAAMLLQSASAFAQSTFTLNPTLSANDSAGLAVGDSVTLTLIVTNEGPSYGSGSAQVLISDNFGFAGASCTSYQLYGPGDGFFEFDWTQVPDSGSQLAPGTSAECDIYLVLNRAPLPSDYPPSATVNIPSTPTDPNPGFATYQFNFASASAVTDLALTLAVNPQSIAVGQNATLAATAQNLGTKTATGAGVSIQLPSQLKFVSSDCGATAAVGNQIVWTLGTISPGASQTCGIQVGGTATSAQPVTISAILSSDVVDSVPGNNSASVNLSVSAAADLAIALANAAPRTIYSLNDSVSLLLTASAPTAATTPSGVEVRLDAGSAGQLANLRASCAQASFTGPTLTWSISGLQAGGQQTCTVTGTVAQTNGSIAVSTSIKSAQTDQNLSNNTASLVLQTYEAPQALIKVPTTKNSNTVALNGDGSVAVFGSQQTDLVPNNQNPNGKDIFRAVGGQLVRENIDASGKQLIGVSSRPAISANGNIVAFQYSKNAVAATTQGAAEPDATGDQLGVMMVGPSGGSKTQVDNGLNGAAPNGTSSNPSLSADGHKLVYCSSASNLVPGDTNNARDIFLSDPQNPAQPPQRISVDSNGAQLPGDSCEPKISADGRVVVFTVNLPGAYTSANRQVVRKDLVTGRLELVSAAAGTTTTGANGDSSQPSVNSDGSTIAYVSAASNLDGLGAAAGGAEVFVAAAGTASDNAVRNTTRARNTGSAAPNGAAQNPSVSCDGSNVAFQSTATNYPGSSSNQLSTFVYSPQASAVAAVGNRGLVNNANPSISCDGTALGFDSNQKQPNTSSTNQNVFVQQTPPLTLDSSFSGQWADPTQAPGKPGDGLVIEVTDSVGTRAAVVTWYVFQGGRATWVLGVSAPPRAGTGADAGLLVVDVPDVYIAQGKSFPLGQAKAAFTRWGSMTLKFASNTTATMSWTSTLPGFNSGSMQLNHFANEDLPSVDPANAKISACQVGGWSAAEESGAGFELDITTIGGARVLIADWFAFDPKGNPIWLAGTGSIGSTNTVTATLYLLSGAGAQFPPLFDANQLVYPPPQWGTVTFTFVNDTRIDMTWNSPVSGYGSGQRTLSPAYTLSGRVCTP